MHSWRCQRRQATFISLALELNQGWVVDRSGDINDVLGATTGALLCALAYARLWPALVEHLTTVARGASREAPPAE